MFSSFMVNAWVIGSVVAVVAGVVGFFVVMRGSAFAAHAIPNGAFAGAAGANLIASIRSLDLGSFRSPPHSASPGCRGAGEPTPSLRSH